MIEAYPLNWPAGYVRTPVHQRTRSRFEQGFDKAQWFLREELRRMGATEVIVSTNLRYRRDGLLYTDELNRKIDDPGVAIYFKYNKKEVSMCCDKYLKVWENIYALGKGIEALRTIDRHEISEFLDRAFTGFTALPPPFILDYKRDWWEVLGLTKEASFTQIRNAYLEKAKVLHPDAGGSDELFKELAEAYKTATEYAKC